MSAMQLNATLAYRQWSGAISTAFFDMEITIGRPVRRPASEWLFVNHKISASEIDKCLHVRLI